ncbi:MAG: hypothetical protein ACE15C_20360 [Phycisphaerae bacterium]
MIAIPDPETMTADERRLEVADILAGGLLRRVLAARAAMSSAGQIVAEVPEKRLDAPAESRLSVAQRPGG